MGHEEMTFSIVKERLLIQQTHHLKKDNPPQSPVWCDP